LVFKAIVNNQALNEERFEKIYESLALDSPEILLAELQELVPEFTLQQKEMG
jgi:hypothetical protein